MRRRPRRHVVHALTRPRGEGRAGRPQQYSREEIALKLARGRRLEAEGVSTRRICQRLEVTELTYLRWKRRFGALDDEAIPRMVELEQENERLRAVIARMEAVLGLPRGPARVEAC